MAAEQESVTPVTPAVEESESLADHEAQFGAEARRSQAVDVDEDEGVDELPRARAKSQQAKPTDYDEIAAYTKRLREAETELGLSLERRQGESTRVYNLRRQAEIAEALREAKKAPAAPTPAPAVPNLAQNAPRTALEAFSEVEPKQEDFALEDNPFAAWSRAVASYDRRKERFEERQAEAKAAAEVAEKEFAARQETLARAHGERVTKFIESKPDFWQVVEKVNDLGEIPPLLVQAIVRDDKGPELMYYLAHHPDELSEMILITDGKPVTDQAVALLRRRLTARDINVASNGATGALPLASPTRVIPRPPTPVRTGSIKTDTSDLPTDESDLTSHEKAFGPRSRFARSRR